MWPFTKTANTNPTLKQRVAEFWHWYAKNAERFYKTIENKQCSDLQPEVSEAVDRWLTGMAWVFGPGENNQGHSFTLSGEGILPKQFVAEYWLQRAPQLPGWTFYASRQASNESRGFTLELNQNEKFQPGEFWVCPYVDVQEEKIDIAVWHPSIHRLDQRIRFQALFLMLDELLGEHGTQNWIGEIKFSEDQLKQSIPIFELPEMIEETQKSHGWVKYAPTETYSSYQLKKDVVKEERTELLRYDVIAGTSRYFRLIGDYNKVHGPCEHPFPDMGVDYIFVPIPTSHFPKGSEVDGRSKIEDEIIEALEGAASGISIGGATGVKNCYMDFMIYDGDRSIKIVMEALKRHRVPKGTRIHFFTSDRSKDVISL
ncbi:MAG: hypothetical protein NTY98_26885 [Verrucomicrobia bacterium]|nr:hypothetical protein [Verrucomicrobiota bacterium]